MAKVSFRVTTYLKLARGETGMTQIASKRLNLGEAVDWIFAELPDDAITITPDEDGDNDVVTIRIDWNKVPGDIRAGKP